MITFLTSFCKCFSRKIAFKRFVGFILAFILSYNKKTITGIYRFLGCDDNLSNYHRFLSRCSWSMEKMFEILFRLVLNNMFALQQESFRKILTIIVDSTVIEKSGEKTEGLDKYYSSTHRRQQKGNEIVRLSIVLRIHGIGVMEFPFMCRLYVTEKSIKKFNLKVRYFTREAIGALMVEKLRQWTDIPILVIGDALYSTETTINPIRKLHDVNLISRRRSGDKKSGVCWEKPPQKSENKRGRPRVRGKEIRFNDIEEKEFTLCKYTKVGKEETAMVKRFDDVLIRKCKDPVTIIVVIDKNGERYVLVSTDGGLTTREIIELYRVRFQIEFGFRDTKQYLGFGDYQVRKYDSITKHCAISQTAYSLCKMLYVLCPQLRQRAKAVFYLNDYEDKNVFSMMSLKEELRDDFFAWLFGKPNEKLNYLDLIFENDRYLTGNHEKIPLKSIKSD